MTSRQPHTNRVLVVDDDPVIRRIVSTAIRKEGFQPVEVTDGAAAYRILHDDANFCAAVLDMMMPNIKGIDIIRYMGTERRLMRIPVMMITSETELGLMKTSFEAGVTMFLPKPFTAEKLQTALLILLQSAAHSQDNGTRRSTA